jgi:hypothetical protein
MNTIIENATDISSAPAKSYTDITAKWKALAADRKITSADVAARCIHLAISQGEGRDGAISRLKKAFTPVTNPVKLANGAAPYYSLYIVQLKIITEVKNNRGNVEVLKWLTSEEREEIRAITNSFSVFSKDME